MNRKLLSAAGLLFALTITGIIVGFVALPGVIIPALLCTFPSFLLLFGAWLGRVSNEYELVNKQRPPALTANKVVRPPQPKQELLS